MGLLTLSLIVAHDSRGCIGKDQRVPWTIPSDLRRFRALTVGKICLMGRRTYESLPRPLVHRHHLVLSRFWSQDKVKQESLKSHGEITGDLSWALWERCPELILQGWHPEIMVIGGGEIYAQTLPQAQRVYQTTLTSCVVPNGEAFFPVLPAEEWEILHLEKTEDAQFGTLKFTISRRRSLQRA